jgi:hypothetical protein
MTTNECKEGWFLARNVAPMVYCKLGPRACHVSGECRAWEVENVNVGARQVQAGRECVCTCVRYADGINHNSFQWTAELI